MIICIVALLLQLSNISTTIGVQRSSDRAPMLNSILVAALAEALLVLAVGIPLAWKSVSIMRRLPPVTFSP